MAKYKFPEFNTEIVDPVIISVDRSSIMTDDLNKTASVPVILTDSSGSKFGPDVFNNMPRNKDNWEECSLEVMIIARLEAFKIEE